MAGVVFHVEFGFNETSLTRALESGNYARAEKIIRDSNNPSSLDEGKSNCYKILLVFDLDRIDFPGDDTFYPFCHTLYAWGSKAVILLLTVAAK